MILFGLVPKDTTTINLNINIIASKKNSQASIFINFIAIKKLLRLATKMNNLVLGLRIQRKIIDLYKL